MRAHSKLFWLPLLVAACGGGSTTAHDAAAIDAAAPTADAAPPDAGPFVDRPYNFQVPVGYDGTPTPLVILLHGYGANGFVQSAYWRMGELSDAEGFLYAYPDGTVDQDGKQFWNATDWCCDLYDTGVDDVAYLTWIIDDVSAHYNVDPKRIYFVGHSNGGFMSHRMACDLSTRVAAIVSLAGLTWSDPANCQPTEPVAVLQVHGDMDAVVPYGGNAALPSAAETVARWAAHGGCDATLVLGTPLDLVSNLAGTETRVERHPNCDAAAAELWTIEMGGHVPDLSESWGPAIWAFLEAHPKP